MAYTPGVARVAMAIYEQPERVYELTMKKNSVALVTDGTAVLGLGDIGPAAALPVMEGKALLFKNFAGIDAFPICLEYPESGGDHPGGEVDLPRLRRASAWRTSPVPAVSRSRAA